MLSTKFTNSKLPLILLIAALPTFGGCTGYKLVKQEDYLAAKYKKEPTEYDERVNNPLRASADTIANELRRLDSVNQQDIKPSQRGSTSSISSPDLKRRISLSWVGDVESSTKKVIDLINQPLSKPNRWEFHSEGRAPTSKPLVRIDAFDETALEVLRSVGLQSGSKVGLTVDEKRKKVTLTYLGEG